MGLDKWNLRWMAEFQKYSWLGCDGFVGRELLGVGWNFGIRLVSVG